MNTFTIIDKDTKQKEVLVVIKTTASKKEVEEIIKQVWKIEDYALIDLLDAFEQHEKEFLVNIQEEILF